jgi:methyl-accepting chemotaxis protein
MGRFGIKAKIWLSVAIFGFGYIVLLLLLQWTSSQMQEHMHVASGSLFPAALSSQEAEAAFQRTNKHYNDAVLLLDKKVLASAEQDGQAVLTALSEVSDHTAFNPELQKQASELSERFRDIQGRSKSAYTAMIESSGNMNDRIQSAISGLAQDNKQMESSLRDLRQKISKDFEGELDLVSIWSRRQQTFGIIVFLVVVGGGAGVSSIVISRQIVAPLGRLADRLRDIAQGEGDLTKRLEINSQDEIGQAAKWFNTFMDKLQMVISKLATNTNGVATSSEQMSEVNQTLISNAEETSTQADQVTTAAQQVNQNLQTVSTATGEMSTSIQDIAKNATEAAKVAGEAMKTARDTNTVVMKLGESSAEIGQVIKVITSIAQKTDLLALNATVEAARAGEVGAGFAVVANEVKELAKQTAAATEDISRRIEAIQTDAKGAVKAIETISGIVNRVNEISGSIAAAVEEQSAATNEMSRNVAEAARASEEITRNMNGVAEAAQSTSKGVGDSRQSAEQLAKMSTQLHELVSQFKY